jgi:glycosyltransferase involved in cell wall biosynthesis
MLPEDAPEFLELPTGFIIMFAGNVGAAQDFVTILAAAGRMRDYPDVKWVIVGDGRMLLHVQNKVREMELSDSVHLLGRRPAESMPRYFAAADVMLLTLKRDPIFSLTIPSKLQSYFACAKPVIAGIDGEGARIVEEAGAGFSCPAESPEELALAVLKMYRLSQSERAAMGQKARGYFEANFCRSTLLDHLETWMSEVSSYSSKGG